MGANKISCRTCGGTSFTINDKTAKCENCGAEYDISQLQAKTAKLETEQKTLDSLANDISRLRQLVDQKEAERQKAVNGGEQHHKVIQQLNNTLNAYDENNKAGIKFSFGVIAIGLLLPVFYQILDKSDLSNETCAILWFFFIAVWVILPLIIAFKKDDE